MTLGFIGLGRMGKNIVLHLLEQGIDIVVYNRTEEVTKQFSSDLSNLLSSNPDKVGTLIVAENLEDLVKHLPSPRAIWLMVPNGKPVDDLIEGLIAAGLTKGDTVIDGGNSWYKDSKRRFDYLSNKGIQYIDCGTSGGIEGARHGACLMLGGDEKVVQELSWIWDAVAGMNDVKYSSSEEPASPAGRSSTPHYSSSEEPASPAGRSSTNREANCCGGCCHAERDPASQDAGGCGSCCSDEAGLASRSFSAGWDYFGPAGTGHFVKMVHNAVEYGMNESIAEGFSLLEKSPYKLDLPRVAKNWTRGSVVRGWLMELLAKELAKDPHLSRYTGKVGGRDTGRWATLVAKNFGVDAEVITHALEARDKSIAKPTFSGKVVSALRKAYGGHQEAK